MDAAFVTSGGNGVLAHSYVKEIDSIGNPIRIYQPVPQEVEGLAEEA